MSVKFILNVYTGINSHWWQNCLKHLLRQYELRLFKGKYQNLRLNDIIGVYDNTNICTYRVVGLNIYKDYRSVYAELDNKLLCPAKNQLEFYHWCNQYFKSADILEYGLLAIKLEPTEL